MNMNELLTADDLGPMVHCALSCMFFSELNLNEVKISLSSEKNVTR